jgi:hypothetical protein
MDIAPGYAQEPENNTVHNCTAQSWYIIIIANHYFVPMSTLLVRLRSRFAREVTQSSAWSLHGT